MVPLPGVVDEAKFEQSDVMDVRAQSFPASRDFFESGFSSQFDDGDWEDEDDSEEDDDYEFGGGHGYGTEPECRPQ
jgi:DnaJ family protein A protein 2